MFFNLVVLIGQIKGEPTSHLVSLPGPEARTLPVVVFTVYNRFAKSGWKPRHLFQKVKLFASTAEYFQTRDPRDGDWLLVFGHIETQRFTGRDGRPRSVQYVHGESIQFLWGPPKTFVKGHVMVPKDEYDRLKALTEGMSEWSMPGVDLVDGADVELPE